MVVLDEERRRAVQAKTKNVEVYMGPVDTRHRAENPATERCIEPTGRQICEGAEQEEDWEAGCENE
jgi:hypothetical protein